MTHVDIALLRVVLVDDVLRGSVEVVKLILKRRQTLLHALDALAVLQHVQQRHVCTAAIHVQVNRQPFTQLAHKLKNM